MVILLDILVLLLMAGTGYALWKHREEEEGWVIWTIKLLIIVSLLFGPYWFWDEIGAYWQSSQDGPVNLQQGWW